MFKSYQSQDGHSSENILNLQLAAGSNNKDKTELEPYTFQQVVTNSPLKPTIPAGLLDNLNHTLLSLSTQLVNIAASPADPERVLKALKFNRIPHQPAATLNSFQSCHSSSAGISGAMLHGSPRLSVRRTTIKLVYPARPDALFCTSTRSAARKLLGQKPAWQAACETVAVSRSG